MVELIFRYIQFKLKQDKVNNLNRPMTPSAIKAIIKISQLMPNMVAQRTPFSTIETPAHPCSFCSIHNIQEMKTT